MCRCCHGSCPTSVLSWLRLFRRLVPSTLPVSSPHKKLLRGSFSCAVLTSLICFCVLFPFPLYLPSKTNLPAFCTQDTPIKVCVPFSTIKSYLYLQYTCCHFKLLSFSHSDLVLCPLCCAQEALPVNISPYPYLFSANICFFHSSC